MKGITTFSAAGSLKKRGTGFAHVCVPGLAWFKREHLSQEISQPHVMRRHLTVAES
jgi:hypothetical protein